MSNVFAAFFFRRQFVWRLAGYLSFPLCMACCTQALALDCPSGRYGNGGTNYVDTGKCVDGFFVPKGMEYCEPPQGHPDVQGRKRGNEGLYDPKRQYCDTSYGRVVRLGERYCPQGKEGNGGVFPERNQRCFEGRIMRSYELYCPPKDGRAGRIFNPASEDCHVPGL